MIGFRREVYREEILENARRLKDTNFKDIGITPDLTREQRLEEDELLKEAERRNMERTAEDTSKNVEWILVGQRGEKRLIRMVNRRGGARGATRGGRSGRGASYPAQAPAQEGGLRRKERHPSGGWSEAGSTNPCRTGNRTRGTGSRTRRRWRKNRRPSTKNIVPECAENCRVN